jgi:hypothetical protein
MNLMHEFEFEVRISDQIQTVKMAVARNLKFYLNIVSFRLTKIPHTRQNDCAHMRSLKSELAKLTVSIARQARESHAPLSSTSIRYENGRLRICRSSRRFSLEMRYVIVLRIQRIIEAE